MLTGWRFWLCFRLPRIRYSRVTTGFTFLTFLLGAFIVTSGTGCSSAVATVPSDQRSAPEPSLKQAWIQYRAIFLEADGAILDTYQKISHSEGQGTGMLFAVMGDDKRSFDKIRDWTKKHLQRPDGLHAWRWERHGDPRVPDINNATDGDLLIAWALIMAKHRWGNDIYLQEASRILAAVENKLVVKYQGYQLLLPGEANFLHKAGLTINLSYFIFPAFRWFTEYHPSPVWQQLEIDALRLLANSGEQGLLLPPDWLLIRPDGQLGFPDSFEPRSGYDAVRIPLYLAWCGHKAAMSSFLRYWEQEGGWNVAPSWIDLNSGEQANYLPEQGVLAIRAFAVDAASDYFSAQSGIGKDYYSSSLYIFSLMAFQAQGCLVPNSDKPN